ncbi:hypothetical protein [Coleofasciculus sp. FACHB-64]|nr:hypothetical protein [Coleofasciculus sp. FACHB-64]
MSCEPKDFAVLCQLILGVSAFYDVSIRQMAAFAASFLQTFPRGFALALG